MSKHLKFVPAALISIALAAAISYIMYLIGPGLTAAAEANGMATWNLGAVTEGLNTDIFGSILYILGDLSEGNFVADSLGSIFMIFGGFLAVYLQRAKSPLGGTGAMNNTWVWLMSAQIVAVSAAALVWRYVWPDQWLCSFTTAVSITPLAILSFGKPTFKKWITGVILGAAIVPPLCQLWMINISAPMGWPTFSGCLGIVMPICSIIGYEIMNFLPWMKEDPAPTVDPMEVSVDTEALPDGMPRQSASHLAFQRIWGGDSSELYFWGSNISWIFLMIGWFLSYVLNPANVNFSIYMFFVMIFTTSVAMVFWGPTYQKDGFAWTCGSLLVILALVPSCGTNVWLALVLGVVAAIVSPPIVAFMGKQKFFLRYKVGCIYLQFFTAVIGMVLFYICKMAGLFA